MFTIPDSYQVAGTTFHDAEDHATEHWTRHRHPGQLVQHRNHPDRPAPGQDQPAQLHPRLRAGLRHRHRLPGRVRTACCRPTGRARRSPTCPSARASPSPPSRCSPPTTPSPTAASTCPRSWSTPPSTPRATSTSLPSASPHRVVSTTVAKEMTTMLDEVVRVGTGTAANLDPYTVAGKTGTALVPSPQGGYEAGHYVASFAGFRAGRRPADHRHGRDRRHARLRRRRLGSYLRDHRTRRPARLQHPAPAEAAPRPGVPLATSAVGHRGRRGRRDPASRAGHPARRAQGRGHRPAGPAPGHGSAPAPSAPVATTTPPTTIAPPTTSAAARSRSSPGTG